MMALGRRQMVLGSAGLAASVVTSRLAAASNSVMFAIWRNGEDIGRHQVIFEQGPLGLDVSSYVDITVKVAFITAFSFQQEAKDHWRDGVLDHSYVRTNDDGELTITEIVAQQDTVVIEGPKGQLQAPRGMMTDVCFWNPDIIGQQQLLDTSKGEFHPVRSAFVGEEFVDLPQGQRLAKRYRMESAGSRSGDIWFDEDGTWVDAQLTTRGETLIYQRL